MRAAIEYYSRMAATDPPAEEDGRRFTLTRAPDRIVVEVGNFGRLAGMTSDFP